MELRWVNLSRLLHSIDTTKESDESIQFADVYFGPQMFFCIRYQDELVYETNLSMIKFCFLCFFIRSYFSFASHDDWMSWFIWHYAFILMNSIWLGFPTCFCFCRISLLLLWFSLLKFFNNDLNLTMFVEIFWIRRVVKFEVKKIKRPTIWNGGSIYLGFSKGCKVQCTKWRILT